MKNSLSSNYIFFLILNYLLNIEKFNLEKKNKKTYFSKKFNRKYKKKNREQVTEKRKLFLK